MLKNLKKITRLNFQNVVLLLAKNRYFVITIHSKIYNINNDCSTHFRQFISDSLRKSQAQFREKLRTLRLRQNYGFLVKKSAVCSFFIPLLLMSQSRSHVSGTGTRPCGWKPFYSNGGKLRNCELHLCCFIFLSSVVLQWIQPFWIPNIFSLTSKCDFDNAAWGSKSARVQHGLAFDICLLP